MVLDAGITHPNQKAVYFERTRLAVGYRQLQRLLFGDLRFQFITPLHQLSKFRLQVEHFVMNFGYARLNGFEFLFFTRLLFSHDASFVSLGFGAPSRSRSTSRTISISPPPSKRGR